MNLFRKFINHETTKKSSKDELNEELNHPLATSGLVPALDSGDVDNGKDSNDKNDIGTEANKNEPLKDYNELANENDEQTLRKVDDDENPQSINDEDNKDFKME